jgi:hypothetical protein
MASFGVLLLGVILLGRVAFEGGVLEGVWLGLLLMVAGRYALHISVDSSRCETVGILKKVCSDFDKV